MIAFKSKKLQTKPINIEVRNLGHESYNLTSKNDANLIFLDYLMLTKEYPFCLLSNSYPEAN
jgi:hypothetical protein